MLSDGLYARLFPMFAVVLPVIAEWKVEEVEVEKEVTINGKTIKRKVKHTEKIRKHPAAFENEKLEGITKTRTLSPLTQVELPSVNAWDALENAFDKANTAR